MVTGWKDASPSGDSWRAERRPANRLRYGKTESLEARPARQRGPRGRHLLRSQPHSWFAAADLRHGSAANSSALATRVGVSKAVQDSERDLLNIGASRSVTAVEIVVLRRMSVP